MNAINAQLRIQVSVVAIGLLAVAVTAIGSIRLLDTAGWVALPLMAVIVGGIVALFVIPVEMLPAAAIVLFALIPDKLTPNDGVFGAVPPITAVMLIWTFRRLVLQRRISLDRTVRPPVSAPRAFAILGAVFFVIWAIVSTARSTSTETSITWTVSFVLSALLVMVVPSAEREARYLRSAWLRVGFYLGLYAALEVALQQSPVFGVIYRALGVESVQHWSVYRAEVGFGHPIWAGAFFAPAAVLGIVSWMQSGRTSSLVYGAGAAIGVVATVSRGPIGAVGIGIAAAVVGIMLFTARRSLSRIVAVVVGSAAAAGAVLIVGPVAERSNSVESGLSAGARDLGTTVAIRAAEDFGWLGSGPGTSGISGRVYDDVVIESSLLQLLVSVGIPGVALFIVIVGALVVNAMRVQDVAAAAALLAFVIAISSFNSIDAIRSEHLLLGLVFLICLFPQVPQPTVTPPATTIGSRFDWSATASPLLAGSLAGRATPRTEAPSHPISARPVRRSE